MGGFAVFNVLRFDQTALILSTDQSCLAQVAHYLFLPWNLPWIILACYGNQQKNKKKTKEAINNPDQTALYATSDQDVHGLGINLSNLGPTNHIDQNKKEEEENGCVQAVHSFFTLSKATFDLLDMPTAPGCFAVYSHVSQKRINYQTTITDDSC